MHIREMTPDDLDQVVLVEEANFDTPWTRNGFESQLRDGNSFYLVCEHEGRIVGLCGYIRSFDEADVTNVSVIKECRGHGFATALMTSLLDKGERDGISSFTLEVRVSNADAIHVYEKLGFVSEGIRPGFYDNPKEDAMIMWRRR